MDISSDDLIKQHSDRSTIQNKGNSKWEKPISADRRPTPKIIEELQHWEHEKAKLERLPSIKKNKYSFSVDDKEMAKLFELDPDHPSGDEIQVPFKPIEEMSTHVS